MASEIDGMLARPARHFQHKARGRQDGAQHIKYRFAIALRRRSVAQLIAHHC